MSDYPEAYICRRPKARKDHKCCECGGTILEGEVYNKHSGIWEDGPDSFKVCVDCDELRYWVDYSVPYFDRTPLGGLTDSVFNGGEIDDIRTFLKIKEKRRAKIEKWMVDTFDELFNKEENENETGEL